VGCKPDSVKDDHLSCSFIAKRILRATCSSKRFALAPGRVYHALLSPRGKNCGPSERPQLTFHLSPLGLV